jgi:hypothetical protein
MLILGVTDLDTRASGKYVSLRNVSPAEATALIGGRADTSVELEVLQLAEGGVPDVATVTLKRASAANENLADQRVWVSRTIRTEYDTNSLTELLGSPAAAEKFIQADMEPPPGPASGKP